MSAPERSSDGFETVELPGRGPLLLLSPHLDDAVLSCWALLDGSEPVDVLTVFAGEPDPPQRGAWDVVTGFADSGESMHARRLEDDEAFAGTPHRLRRLSLVEEQYLDGRRADGDRLELAAAVRDWASEAGGGTVAFPAGAGWRGGRWRSAIAARLGQSVNPSPHPDHLFVRAVALETLAGRPDLQPVLYEELPYLVGGRADAEVRRVARAAGCRPHLIALPVDRTEKTRRIGAYASQVPHLAFGGVRMDDPERIPSAERYWHFRPR